MTSSSSWSSPILMRSLASSSSSSSSSLFLRFLPTPTIHGTRHRQSHLLHFDLQQANKWRQTTCIHGGTISPFTCFSTNNSGFDENEVEVEGVKCEILRRWDVPWGWSTIVLTMMACGLSVAVAGLVGATALHYLGVDGRELSLDEKAELLLAGQLLITVVILGVIYGITGTFEPLPDDIFHYDWKNPFSWHDGWLLWAGIGLFGAVATTSLAGVALSTFSGQNPQSEADVLTHLSPLIGSSSVSVACLVGAVGVLAPILEETVFRGFLMVSLTKWIPTPASVLITAALFAIGHLNPEELPQLFLSGAALGFSYAQTRNMLTPITIHALWNTSVTLLTFLQLHGYDI